MAEEILPPESNAEDMDSFLKKKDPNEDKKRREKLEKLNTSSSNPVTNPSGSANISDRGASAKDASNSGFERFMDLSRGARGGMRTDSRGVLKYTSGPFAGKTKGQADMIDAGRFDKMNASQRDRFRSVNNADIERQSNADKQVATETAGMVPPTNNTPPPKTVPDYNPPPANKPDSTGGTTIVKKADGSEAKPTPAATPATTTPAATPATTTPPTTSSTTRNTGAEKTGGMFGDMPGSVNNGKPSSQNPVSNPSSGLMTVGTGEPKVSDTAKPSAAPSPVTNANSKGDDKIYLPSDQSAPAGYTLTGSKNGENIYRKNDTIKDQIQGSAQKQKEVIQNSKILQTQKNLPEDMRKPEPTGPAKFRTRMDGNTGKLTVVEGTPDQKYNDYSESYDRVKKGQGTDAEYARDQAVVKAYQSRDYLGRTDYQIQKDKELENARGKGGSNWQELDKASREQSQRDAQFIADQQRSSQIAARDKQIEEQTLAAMRKTPKR